MKLGQGIVERAGGRNLGAEGLGVKDLGTGQGGDRGRFGDRVQGGRFRERGEI